MRAGQSDGCSHKQEKKEAVKNTAAAELLLCCSAAAAGREEARPTGGFTCGQWERFEKLSTLEHNLKHMFPPDESNKSSGPTLFVKSNI